MTSDEVIARACAAIRKRLPGCDATGCVSRSDAGAGWVAEIDVVGKTGRNIGRHAAHGPTKGTAAAHLAASLGVSIEEAAR